MEIAKVTSKGQITIPKEIRKKLDLRPGSKVVFLNIGNEIVIRKADSLDFDLQVTSPLPTRTVAEGRSQYDTFSDSTYGNEDPL